VTGSGHRVAVLGDSYSVGLGLRDPRGSWPTRLAGRVEVFGFSGSGFAAGSSPCPSSSYGVRARGAAEAAEVVVVEGGLNDVDQSGTAIRAGVRRVLAELRGHRVLLVGPVAAPSRAGRVSRVDQVLAAEGARAGVPYLSMLTLRLPYLADGLHLTAAGHRRFGDAVARRLVELS